MGGDRSGMRHGWVGAKVISTDPNSAGPQGTNSPGTVVRKAEGGKGQGKRELVVGRNWG